MPPIVSVLELERIAALGWQGPVQERLGGWLLRAGGGFTGRANSVLPLGEPGAPLPDALAFVADFYRRQDLPVIVQLPDAGGDAAVAELTGWLDGAGWSTLDRVAVMVTDLTDLVTACPPHPSLPAAALDPAPGPRWLQGYRYRGGPLPAAAVQMLTRAERPVFATVADYAGRAGVARGVVDEGWLGITAVTVEEHRRRAGVGRHLMGELARWAKAHGAHSVYLQVDAANTAALAMYGSLGFATHHHYRYRRPTGGEDLARATALSPSAPAATRPAGC